VLSILKEIAYFIKADLMSLKVSEARYGILLERLTKIALNV